MACGLGKHDDAGHVIKRGREDLVLYRSSTRPIGRRAVVKDKANKLSEVDKTSVRVTWGQGGLDLFKYKYCCRYAISFFTHDK